MECGESGGRGWGGALYAIGHDIDANKSSGFSDPEKECSQRILFDKLMRSARERVYALVWI